MIDVNHVSRHFKIHHTPKDLWGKARSLLVREYTVKRAVDDVSFHIDEGEVVGYVGPNGAGKSTTIKMLSGILTPTSGAITVDGIIPYRSRIENAMKIGVVFGQRSQLYWDLPMRDSFLLHKKMYEIDDTVYKENVSLFTEVLQMEKFIDQPVRQLSLGQKMRANIAISLLHNPKLVYLDEPTIGLDILAKSRIRDFIAEINRKKKTTFILTTHDMDDIESVCQRLIMINYGRVFYDGALDAFRAQYGDTYRIVLQVAGNVPVSHPDMSIDKMNDYTYSLLGDKARLPVAEAIAFLTQHYDVRDIRIQESDIESILKQLYEESL